MNMPESRNVWLFPFQTQLSPHGTIQLSPGKIHAHVQNRHKCIWNTFLDVLKKITYPLVTNMFSCNRYNRIMQPLLQIGLSKGSVVCTVPRALVHSPLKYGGLDLPDLHTEQTVMHVKTLLWFGPDNNHPMGFLMQATAESLWLELGYSREVFAVPAKLGNNLTDSWITHLWKISHEEQLLLLTDFASPPL